MLLPLVSALLCQLPAAPVTFQDGVLTPPLVGAPGPAAVSFARSRSTELGLDARSTLAVGREMSTRLGGTVQLVQQVDGLEVHGGRVIVTFDTQQRVVRYSSSLKRFSSAKLTPALTGAQALAIATHEVDGAWLREDGTPWGGWKKKAFLVGDSLHVGFLTFVPTLKASDSWHVAVDATDGAVLWVENRSHAGNAAKVYASSPGGLTGGVGITPIVDVELLNLTDAGFLTGTRVRALNCCPTANCDPDAGPARATGQTQTFQGVVNFDVAICDQRQRATNDRASGDYVYAPVDPPNTLRPSITKPADYDEFAEVHAYFHMTKAYEATRALSVGPLARDGGFSPFAMRNAGPDLPAVWVNVADADFQSAMPNAQGVYVTDQLARTDNALFLARENMDALLLPAQVLASDALVIYQGAAADFAYDGPVLWHEFGHGAIHSTADWDTVVTIDARSSNNESSALHEGVADLIAAFTGNDPIVGAYVGPRITPGTTSIRNVDNADRCPDVLWGESHQDSLHFTGAVWEARAQFLGLDNGATFDAAVYAAIVSFPPDVNFEKAAQIITSSVALAFPARADARSTLQGLFDGRGVTNCSKVLDVTDTLSTPRTYFGIPGSVFAGVNQNTPVPGPYQFKIRAPRGVKSVTVSSVYQSFGNATTARLEVLASDLPITFTPNAGSLINDAVARVVPTVGNQMMTATVPINVPCGGEVFVAIANTSQRDRQLYDVQLSFVPADECPEPVVDAGVPAAQPVTVPASGETLGAPAQGCGCTSTVPFMFAPALLWLVRRRAKR